MAIEGRIGWIHKSNVHDGWRKWFCRSCNRRTDVELNPQWVADGKPMQFELNKYSWFARCARCNHQHYHSEYECPYCGKPVDEREPIRIENYRSNPYYSYEFGVTGYDWIEVHRCSTCGRHFSFTNSSC